MHRLFLFAFSLAVPCYLATYTHHALGPVSEAHEDTLATTAFNDESESIRPEASIEIPDSRNLEQLADSLYIGTVRKGSAAYHTLLPLFVEWGATDPIAAMAYLENAPQGIQRFSQAVLRGWAQSGDLAQACLWIENKIGQPLSAPFYKALINGLADVDRSIEALELALGLNSSGRNDLAQHAVQHWAQQDQPAASRWIENNEAALPPRLQESVLSGYARAWAKQSPKAASEWAQSLPSGPTRSSSLYAAVDQWMQRDATAAGYWIFSQKKDDEIEEVLSENAHQISHVDPQAAFEFIENDPANEEDPYRMRGHLIMALENVMRKAPAEADPWIKRVEAQTLAAASQGLTHARYQVSQNSYAKMVNRWAAEDEDAAFTYLETASHIREADREAIETEAIERLQTTDPEKAAHYLFKRWKDTDQAAAVDFAATTSQDHLDVSVSNFKSHYQTVAAAWAETDPQKASYYVERQEALDPEETAELLVSMHP